MFAASRRSASLAYLGSIVCTLVCVFVLHLGLLALLSILVQSLALGWYTLSYIPYGQAAAKRILRRLLKRAGLSTSLLDAAVSSSSSSSSSLSASSGGSSDAGGGGSPLASVAALRPAAEDEPPV
jgi:uncharacterized membrane protein YgcG